MIETISEFNERMARLSADEVAGYVAAVDYPAATVFDGIPVTHRYRNIA